jgi:hypothetical protein
MFTTSLVHCAPRKPPIAMTGTASERIAGDAPALVVGGPVAATEVARGGRRDAHDAGLGVVRGDDREHAHARGSRQEPFGRLHAVEPVLHDDDGHAVDELGVAAERRRGILRLRAQEHELGAQGEHRAGGDACVHVAVAAREPDAVGADRLEPGAARR